MKILTLDMLSPHRENKKAQKNEKQRSEEKNRNCSAKKGPNFGLCASAKVKYCTFLHELTAV